MLLLLREVDEVDGTAPEVESYDEVDEVDGTWDVEVEIWGNAVNFVEIDITRDGMRWWMLVVEKLAMGVSMRVQYMDFPHSTVSSGNLT